MNLPALDFAISPEAVKANRDKIDAAKAELKALQHAVDGLEAANQDLCKHPNKRSEYDPGYAGGGFSGHYCPDCRRRGYF